MTSVRTYMIERDRGVKELQEDLDTFTQEFGKGVEEVTERIGAAVVELQEDSDKYGREFWEGE